METIIYKKQERTIAYYSIIITCFIIGILLQRERLLIIDNRISHTISSLLLLISYILFLKVAHALKKSNVHGVVDIAWASFLLYTFRRMTTILTGNWWDILRLILIVFLVFVLVNGIIRFLMSLLTLARKAVVSGDRTINAIDIVIAAATSVTAIVISIIR